MKKRFFLFLSSVLFSSHCLLFSFLPFLCCFSICFCLQFSATFARMDKDNSGSLSKGEVLAFFKEVLKL